MAFHVQLNRHEEKIRSYEAYPIETEKLLLYGSSFFTNWGFERAREQCSAATDGRLQVVNHGFGGATADELLYYWDRMVRPYRPKAIVFRPGINDINKGLNAQETFFLTKRLVEFALNDNPDVRLAMVNVFDNAYLTEEKFAQTLEYNHLCEQYAVSEGNLTYIDLNPFFHENPADCGTQKKLRNVFVSDGLHLTDDGYVEMAQYLAPRMESILNR